MSALLHTEGPLHYKPDGGTANFGWIFHGNGHWLARIQHNGEAVVARQVADGHLFAAATDLLAALEEARNCLLWYRDLHPESDSGADDEAMARIDAAIAKAGGSAA